MSSVVTTAASSNARRRIYAPVACLAVVIALAGFWPSYFGPLVAGSLRTVSMIHVHAAVFVGWLLLVVVQALLAANGRRALHVRVGRYGMWYGLFVIAVGLATAFDQFAMRIAAGAVEEARNKLFVPLTDMAVFAPFFAAAWIYRDRPEIHKRLIIVATTILLIAAVHRLTILGARPAPAWRILLVWLAPIYLAMAYDFAKQRIIHPVYLLGIAAIVYLKFFRIPLYQSDAWKKFSGWLTTFYL